MTDTQCLPFDFNSNPWNDIILGTPCLTSSGLLAMEYRNGEGICLLCDFDDKLLTSHPSEYLRVEDERLARMDKETETWWKSMQTQRC